MLLLCYKIISPLNKNISTTTLFDAQANSDNGRYIFKGIEATINNDNKLWLYFGTGDTQKLQDQSSKIKNRAFGIKDKDFPDFKISFGVPLAIILQLDKIIAISTHDSKSLAWWSQIQIPILSSVCKFTITFCSIWIVKTSNAAKHSSKSKILGSPSNAKAITSFFFWPPDKNLALISFKL